MQYSKGAYVSCGPLSPFLSSEVSLPIAGPGLHLERARRRCLLAGSPKHWTTLGKAI